MADDRRRWWKNAAFCTGRGGAAAGAAPVHRDGLLPVSRLRPAASTADDEPHYLVLINSLLDDGDLDVSNNYASVHAGGQDAGLFYAVGRNLDHHALV